MHRLKCVCLLLLVLLGIAMGPLPVGAGVSKMPNILFLSSYHAGFDTLPDQTAGITQALSARKWRFDIAYMDTKRLDTPPQREAFRNHLAFKLGALAPYDLVLAGDDNALQFVMDERESLFSGIPVVYFCINDFERARRAAQDPLMTGVVEQTSLADNVRLAKMLEPGLVRLVGIVDDTLTGQGDRLQFEALAPLFPEITFETCNASQQTFEALEARISTYERGTALFFLTMFEDSAGRTLSIDQGVEFLVRSARVPVYRASVGGVGDGLVGGKMVSYVDQGRIAAEKVILCLRKHAVVKGGIMLELTESALIDNLDAAVATLHELRAQGIPVCLSGRFWHGVFLPDLSAQASVGSAQAGSFVCRGSWTSGCREESVGRHHPDFA